MIFSEKHVLRHYGGLYGLSEKRLKSLNYTTKIIKLQAYVCASYGCTQVQQSCTVV